MKFLHRPQSGIAIAPILFIVALLAILATVIAVGSGTFSSGSDHESARTLATTIISTCRDYQAGVQRVLAQGCDVTKLDYTPNVPWPASYAYNSDHTGGNGTNMSGNGSCALFHANGGGLNWKNLPSNYLVENPTGGFISFYGAATAQFIDAFAGYPFLNGVACYYNRGTCAPAVNNTNSNAAIMLFFYYLKHDLCLQINKILGFNIDPDSFVGGRGHFWTSLFMTTLKSKPTSIWGYQYMPWQTKYWPEGCGRPDDGVGVYAYTCPVLIR